MKKTAELIGVFIIGMVIIFLVSLLLAFPTMLLWNWLLTDIFQLKEVSFWQAWGLNILTGIFFRSDSTSKKDE